MRRIDLEKLPEWLEKAPGSGYTGFDVTGWEASAWILHAMSEIDALPNSVTSAGKLGPGSYRRLRWHELASRTGVSFVEGDWPDARRFHPVRPSSICGPDEGSLDYDQFVRLLHHLARVSAAGFTTPCIALYGGLRGDPELRDAVSVWHCRLDELKAAYETLDGSPTNLWPEDRSWFVYTDWDLAATKVSGGRVLLDAVREDPELETVSAAQQGRNTPRNLR